MSSVDYCLLKMCLLSFHERLWKKLYNQTHFIVGWLWYAKFSGILKGNFRLQMGVEAGLDWYIVHAYEDFFFFFFLYNQDSKLVQASECSVGCEIFVK